MYLIYGHNGWIGKQLINLLDSMNIKYVKGKSRLENKEELEQEIININPSYVISFTGRTHGSIGDKEYTTIDYLELKGKIYENVRDNLFGPIVLCNLAVKYNFHLTYLGTGCIFQFDNNHPFGQEINGFTENDKPNLAICRMNCDDGLHDKLNNYELTKLMNNHSTNLFLGAPKSGKTFIF